MTEQPRLLHLGKPVPYLLDRLRKTFDVTLLQDQPDRAAFLAAEGAAFRLVSADGNTGLDDDLRAHCPNVEVLSSYGVGYDAIDAGDAAGRGIIVTHTPTVLDKEVADTALMLWLAAAKQLVAAHDWAASGAWEREGPFPFQRGIRDRTVAILGLGRIGMEIAKLAQVFGSRILYTARGPKDVPFDFVADLTEMARQADVLFVICPLTDETRHIVTREVMDALGPDGILINIARGPVVDEAALVAAIADGTLGHAALDVFEAEPKVSDGLKGRANVTLAPHIGSATVETRRAMSDLVCRNLESYARDGTVLTPVPECRHLATLSDEPV